MTIPSHIPGFSGTREPTPFEIVPTQGFYKKNLKSRTPLSGHQDDIQSNVPPMLNNITNVAAYRRNIMCKNDLRVKVLRGPKDKFAIYNSLQGVARNQKSIFPRVKNNHPLLVPADSQNAYMKNSLGLPK